MKKTDTKARVKQEMDPEYRFDYGKAKPNRFAEKLKLNAGWTVEKFVAEEKKEIKINSPVIEKSFTGLLIISHCG